MCELPNADTNYKPWETGAAEEFACYIYFALRVRLTGVAIPAQELNHLPTFQDAFLPAQAFLYALVYVVSFAISPHDVCRSRNCIEGCYMPRRKAASATTVSAQVSQSPLREARHIAVEQKIIGFFK